MNVAADAADKAKYHLGQVVVLKNRRGEHGTIVSEPRKIGGRYFYRVLFQSNSTPVQVQEADLAPYEISMSPEDMLHAGQFGDKSTFSRLITYERLQNPLQDTLYSLRASRTEFQAYQFKPLLKFLRSSKHRLLLADEVGLGKTIEAGFILSEIIARSPHSFRRALIVCKASLCIKWQTEMRKRFDLKFDIWRATQLREFLDRYREDEDLELRAICSLESFRNQPLMEAWEAMPPPLDVLIIDEAHHLKNADTKVHKACRNAAESADAVLALTATPIQIGSRDLFNLLSLLDEEEFASFPYFEACMLFNSHIVAAERKVAQRDADRFDLAAAMLRALGENDQTLFKDVWSSARFGSSVADLVQGWTAVSQTLRKHPLYDETLRLLHEADPSDQRATVEIQRNLAELNFLSRIFSRTRRRDVYQGSSRQAKVVKVQMSPAERELYTAVINFVRESYRASGKDSVLLFGLMMPQRQLASCIPAMVEYYSSRLGISPLMGGVDDEDSDLDREDWAGTTSEMPNEQAMRLRQIIQQWKREEHPDSKFAALKRSLEELQVSQPGAQIVIFSYFKKTLEYLANKLHALGYSNTVISGSFSPEDREKRIAGFREGRYQILLSSEVGSEGLDFQFCNILFNYDLPWNPMVVEQRIGRLDRFGQKAPKILIFNLSAPGTIEDEILNRLYSRINLFESYIGDLEMILGSEISNLTKDLFDADLSEGERRQRIEHAGFLLEQRKLQYEEWERESPRFIGLDEFYWQEVDRAQRLGRFIRAEDLAVFVRDFLSTFDTRSELEQESPGIYTLHGAEKLYQLLLRQPDDQMKAEFCRLLLADRLKLTFDSAIAEENREISFVHVRHFFIRAIVDEYRQTGSSMHPVAQVALNSAPELPRGTYLYLLGRATIRAMRAEDSMLPVFIELESKRILDEDTSELFLGKMVTDGQDASAGEFDAERLLNACEIANSVLVERFQERRESAERINRAFVNARETSVMDSYRLKISRKQNLLSNARAKQQQASYIRMLEGTIRRLEAERDLRRQEIAALATVTADHSVKAAGILHVT